MGIDPQQQIRDVPELDVIDMGAVAAAPARVEAHQFRWDAAQRMVDDLDAPFEEGAVLRHIPIGIEHPRCAELRFIDLHDETGIGDCLVFLATCIGDGCHVVVFFGIVLVADAGTKTEWSECGEIALDVLAGDRRLKVGDIALHRGLSGICYGTGAASTFLLGGIVRLSWNREARPDRAA